MFTPARSPGPCRTWRWFEKLTPLCEPQQKIMRLHRKIRALGAASCQIHGFVLKYLRWFEGNCLLTTWSFLGFWSPQTTLTTTLPPTLLCVQRADTVIVLPPPIVPVGSFF